MVSGHAELNSRLSVGRATAFKHIRAHRPALKILQNGGIDAKLLKKQPIPDGPVAYAAEVKKFCGAACAGH